MRLLVLGGTIFLGRHVVEAALARGCDVTLFHRGQTSPGLFPAARELLGDRRSDLAALSGGAWDAVIDTCGYAPSVVARSASALAGCVGRYVFVSSISVYAELGSAGDREIFEDAPLGTMEGDDETVTGPTYGPLKARCEAAVAEVFGSRALLVRPGLIVGPHDPTDRFTYWVRRFAQGGDALAPGDGSTLVQVIDVRDLAAWLVAAATGDASGAMNAVGPSVPMRDLLASCAAAAAAAGLTPATPRWTEAKLLADAGVQGWTDLPAWVDGWEQRISAARATAAGLRCRPLVDTAAATLAWDRTRDQGAALKAGLTPERERDLRGGSRGGPPSGDRPLAAPPAPRGT